MNFFDGINIMPNGIHIVVGATNRPTGEAFVEFTSSDEAQCGMDVAAKTLGLTTENCSGQPKGTHFM
jgi:heterogeneous nuclear ribonucleoprotein F/H/epithelial splicing regulatory protein 1/2